MKNQLNSVLSILKSRDKNWEQYWKKISRIEAGINASLLSSLVDLSFDRASTKRKIVPDVLRTVSRQSALYKKVEGLLLEMLKSEKSPSVISAIGFANIDLKSHRIAKEMINFSKHKNGQVRLSVIRATDNFRSDSYLKMLAFMAKDKSPLIRSWAQFTIANSYLTSGRSKIRSSNLKKIFLKLSKDKSPKVRAEAKSILKEFYANK